MAGRQSRYWRRLPKLSGTMQFESAFPLTPALSRGEREKRRQFFEKLGAVCGGTSGGWVYSLFPLTPPSPAGRGRSFGCVGNDSLFGDLIGFAPTGEGVGWNMRGRVCPR